MRTLALHKLCDLFIITMCYYTLALPHPISPPPAGHPGLLWWPGQFPEERAESLKISGAPEWNPSWPSQLQFQSTFKGWGYSLPSPQEGLWSPLREHPDSTKWGHFCKPSTTGPCSLPLSHWSLLCTQVSPQLPPRAADGWPHSPTAVFWVERLF